MNILKKINEFLFKPKKHALPEPKTQLAEGEGKQTQQYVFKKSLETKNDAFSKLLRPENMARINIDEELRPLFEDMIIKIRDYFVQNDLMSVKDFEDFFEKHLLDGKLIIRLGNENELPFGAGAMYTKGEDKGEIVISEKSRKSHDLCHEFIHFLTMADSDGFGKRPSMYSFINEGYTELLASEIDKICPQAYFQNVKMVKFLNLFSKTKNGGIKAFLNDRFDVGDDYMWRNIGIACQEPGLNSYRWIQEIIIRKLVDFDSIKSIEDYIHVVEMLKQRPSYHKKYMESYFNDLNERFLINMDLPVNEETMMLLNQYCSFSYKAEVFGDRKVVEFDFDEINGAFDVEGNIYGDYPNGGWYIGSVRTSRNYTRCIQLSHNNRKQTYSLENFDGINWQQKFDEAKRYMYTYFGYKEEQPVVR